MAPKKYEEKRAVILKVSDWQCLFIDRELIRQGHSLEEGDGFVYYLELSEKYNLKSTDFVSIYIELYDHPELIKEIRKYGKFKNDYEYYAKIFFDRTTKKSIYNVTLCIIDYDNSITIDTINDVLLDIESLNSPMVYSFEEKETSWDNDSDHPLDYRDRWKGFFKKLFKLKY